MAFVAAVTDGGAATVRVPARGARCRALRYDRGASSYHRPHHRVARPEVFFFSAARKPFDRHYRLMTGVRFAPPVGPLHAHTHTHTHTHTHPALLFLNCSLSLSLSLSLFRLFRKGCARFVCWLSLCSDWRSGWTCVPINGSPSGAARISSDGAT